MKAHGIMYHHFHDDKVHVIGQGSISAEQFDDMLSFYGRDHNIICAEEFMLRSERGSLRETDVCLTFDDGLLCQYDVAYPVMKSRGLTAFWFIYTSPLNGVVEKLEIYRHFRSSMFPDIEAFYESFFDLVKEEYPEAVEGLKTFDPDEYAKEYSFYTPNDKIFRHMRNDLLGEQKYNGLMDNMLARYGYDIEKNAEILWVNKDNIRDLHDNGHVIGLHSYSHPTAMVAKDYNAQCYEYGENKKQLEKVIGQDIVSVSYPCNSYNADSLKCMRQFGIRIGFRANMEDVCLEEPRYEYPREDHANILKKMENRE